MPESVLDRTIEPDPVIEYYKQFVDREALRENLKLIAKQRRRLQTGQVREYVPSTYGIVPAIPDTIEPDPVIEAYKKDVDRTLLYEQLKRTPTERIQRAEAVQEMGNELRRAMLRATAGR